MYKMAGIEVPKDGDCLLHSIALAYLTSCETREILEKKISILTGNDCEISSELVYGYIAKNNESFNFILSTNIWKAIVHKFRQKIINLMTEREEHFIFSENNWYGFLSENNNFYNKKTFSEYLLEVKKPGVWLGSLEIQAACCLLDTVISVHEANHNLLILAKFGNTCEQTSKEINLIFDKSCSHYNPIIDCVKKSIKRKFDAKEDETILFSVTQFYNSYLKSKRTKVDIENKINFSETEEMNNNEIMEEMNNNEEIMEIDADLETVSLQPPSKEDYSASGLKRSLHGTIYQVQLLMLFAHRGQEMFDFLLATEMDDAEKFDDVVFQYKESEKSPWKIRFLQAKHKQDIEKTKITVTELSSIKDDDFSIHKYFVSFCKIQNNTKFNKIILDDFAICTNTYLDIELNQKKQNKKISEEKEYWRELFENTNNLENDDILYFIKECENSKEYKFKEEFDTEIGRRIKEILKKRIRETKNNCEEYIKKVLNSKLIAHPVKKDIEQYISENNLIDITGTLIVEVVNTEENILKIEERINNKQQIKKSDIINLVDKILQVNNMPGLIKITSNFKNMKRTSLLDKANYLTDTKKYFKEAIESVKKLEYWFNCNNTDDKEKTKLSDLTFALDSVDRYIGEFINKFRIIVEYPNETEINRLLNEEIGEEFDLMNASLVCHSFERQMWNWLKEKEGTFFSKHNCKKMFESIRQLVNTLITSGIAKNYSEYLESIKVKFDVEKPSEIKKFINDTEQKIFHLETGYPQLGSLIIYQTLKFDRPLLPADYCIFLKLDTLMLHGIQKIALNSFTQAKNDKLFIIECQALNTDFGKIKALHKNLKIALEMKESKRKLILISTKDHDLAKLFAKIISSRVSFNENFFNNIEKSCQDQILGNWINFQGKTIKLGDIVGICSADYLLSGEIITSIFNKERLSIDAEYNCIESFYKKAYYIPRRLHYQEVSCLILKEKGVFFISDVSKDELIRMGPDTNDIYDISNNLREESVMTCKVLLSSIKNDNSENFMLFQRICLRYQNQSLLWLKHLDRKFYLMASNHKSNYFQNFVIKEDQVTSSCFLEESDTIYAENKIVLISECPGMGKSTLLDSVSYNIKERNPTAWVTKIRLLDFGTPDHECSLSNIVFVANDVKSAIKFCISLMLFNENASASKILSENIIYYGLDPTLMYNIKIYIFLDGFDEISPDYKEKVLTFIKALQLSKVHQIWITTRPHMKVYLENELKCLAFTLNHWIEQESKRDFLCKYWKYILKRDELKFEDIVGKVNNLLENTQWYPKNIENLLKKLQEQLSKKIIEELDFVGFSIVVLAKWNNCLPETQKSVTNIPLHLKMFARVIFSNLDIVMSDFNIFDFFHKFVKIKIGIYQTNKRIFSNYVGASTEQIFSYANLETVHKALAAKFFLPQYESLNLPGLDTIQSETSILRKQYSFERKQMEYQDEFENRENQFNLRLTRVGLLQINSLENYTFLHQSFGEFFLCLWLGDNIKHEVVQIILFRLVLLNSEYSLTQTFFEKYLLLYYSLNEPLRQIKLKEPLLQELVEHEVETDMNETILHIATRNEYIYTAFFILETFRNIDIRYTNKTDNYYLEKFLNVTNRAQETALENAAFLGKDKSFGLLVHYYSYRSFIILCISMVKHRQFISENKNFCSILLIIIQNIKFNNYDDLFKFLLAQIVFNVHDVNEYNSCTLLHRLIVLKNCHGVKMIIKEIGFQKSLLKQVIFSTTNYGTTTLNLAVEKECFKEALLILEGIRGYPDMIKTLFLKQDIYGYSILMHIRNNYHFLPKILTYLAEEVPHQFKLILEELILTPTNSGVTIFKYQPTFNTVIQYFKNNFDLLVDFTLITLYQKEFSNVERKRTVETIKRNYLEIFPEIFPENLHQLDMIKNHIDQIPNHTEKLLILCQDIKLDDLITLTNSWSSTYFKQVMLATKVHKLTFLNTLVDVERKHILNFLLNKIKNFSIVKAITLNSDNENGTIFHMAVKHGYTEFFQHFLDQLRNTSFIRSIILKLDKQQRHILHVITESATQTFIYSLLNNLDQNTAEELITTPIHTCDRTFTPLELTIIHNNVNTFQPMYSFLMKQANIYVDTEELLYLSVKNGSVDIFKELLKVFGHQKLFCSENYNIISTLLFYTSEQNNPNMTNLLVSELNSVLSKKEECSKGCLLVKNDYNETILHKTCLADVSFENSKVLLDFLSTEKELFSQLLLAKDNFSQTPFHLAVFYKNTEMVSHILYLINHNRDLDTGMQLLLAADDDQIIPLLCSSKSGNILIFNLIFNFSLNVLKKNFPNIIEQQVLHQDIEGSNILLKLIRNISAADDNHSCLYRTVLHYLRDYPELLNQLLLMTDYNGLTILHPHWYEDAHISVLKMSLEMVDNKIVKELLLTENNDGITALQMSYWDSEEDKYLQFLISLFKENGLDVENMLTNLRNAYTVRKQLNSAIDNFEFDEIGNIFNSCTNFLKEVLFEDSNVPSIVALLLKKNNSKLVQKFINHAQDKELLAKMFTKYALHAALHCSFELFQMLLIFINGFENKTFLYRCLLDTCIVDCIQTKSQIDKVNMKETLKLVKDTINQIALSATNSLDNLTLSKTQIKNLKHYVQSNNYSGTHRDELLFILKHRYTI